MKRTVILQNEVYDDAHTIQQTFGVTPGTMREWIKGGVLPEPVMIGRHRFFNRQEVERRLLNK
jgi:predicted site-specific integrase-resolvase